MGNKLIASLFVFGILLFIVAPVSASKLAEELEPSLNTQNSFYAVQWSHKHKAIKKGFFIVKNYQKKPLASEEMNEKFNPLNIKTHPSYKFSVTVLDSKIALMTMYKYRQFQQ